jgi:hypothetical protein
MDIIKIVLLQVAILSFANWTDKRRNTAEPISYRLLALSFCLIKLYLKSSGLPAYLFKSV